MVTVNPEDNNNFETEVVVLSGKAVRRNQKHWSRDIKGEGCCVLRKFLSTLQPREVFSCSFRLMPAAIFF